MRKRILIIGAGISGEIIGREISHGGKAELIGYVDDDPDKLNTVLNGKPILGDCSAISSIISKHEIQQVIISIPSAEGKTIKNILKKLIHTDVQIQFVPGYYDILEQDIKIDYPIRDIDVSDLLGRPQSRMDVKNVASYLHQKTVLVTGAGGSIGRELCKLIASVNPSRLILLGRGENSIFEVLNELKHHYPNVQYTPTIVNITNYSSLEKVFTTYQPDVVFHAAAHKHVNFMENNAKEAFHNNVLGSQHLIELSRSWNVEKFVLISSDKAVQPRSVMGLTKRITELVMSYYANSCQTIFCAVRFGNVLGSRGSVLPLFKDQIRRGGPVTITHRDVVRYFMTIPEASQLVLKAGSIARGREIFILNMGEPVRINDLAKLLIQLYSPKTGREVELSYVGLRPGEKLEEELWTPSEEAKASNEKDIYVVYPEKVDKRFMNSLGLIKLNMDSLSDKAFRTELFSLIDTDLAIQTAKTKSFS